MTTPLSGSSRWPRARRSGASRSTPSKVRRFPFDTLDGGPRGVPIGSFGVSGDGKGIVVHCFKAGREGGVVVLDLETGQERSRHRVGDGDQVHFSAPSWDGRQLAYTLTKAVHLLDLGTGKEIRRFQGVGEFVFHVAFSPDGKHLAASVRAPGGDDDWVECWEVSTGESVQVFRGHKGHITSVVFSADGKHILSGGEDETARLWRVKE